LRFDTRDIAKTNLDKNDFKHLAATQGPKEEETMNESTNITESTQVVTGKPAYVDKKVSQWKKQGYKVEKIHKHPNGDVTVKLINDSQEQGVSENVSRQDMEISADTMTLDDFVDVYGEENEHIWHDVNPEQGMSEDMDSLTFWKQQAQKAGGSDKIDWHAIGVEHGRQGMNLNPPYGAGARAVRLYGKGLDVGAQGVSEGDDTPGYIKYEQMKDQIAKVLVKLYHQGTDSETIKQMGDRVAKHLGYDPDDEIFQTAWTRSFNDASLDGAFDDTDADDHTDYSMRQGEMGNPDRMRGIQEGRWNNKSSRKTSRAVQGKTEVIVRHAHAVDEEYAGSRSQRKNIKAIFIQNKEGERFKYPFIHTAGAFAMAQHVDHGGTPHDPAGKAIIGMSEHIAQLAEFQRKVQHASLHDDATGITERAIGRLHELKSQIAALGRRSHYESWMEGFNEEDMMDDGLTMDEVTMEQYKQTFTQSSFQEELTGYFPLLHRIMSEVNRVDLTDYVQETQSKECDKCECNPCECDTKVKEDAFDAFEDWADATEQGRLTDDQIALMKQALEELPQDQSGPELKLGPDGQTAWQFFNELGIEDSDLEDKFKDMANVDAETNALEVFKLWATDNYPELTVALGMSGTQAPAEPAPADPAPAEPMAPKTPAAENMDGGGIPKMMSKESMIKEVAKLVKSRFNEDNPEVGPFNGAPNIALDIKKSISEKFGEQAGAHAEQLALEFMEKLSQRWEEKHGPVGGDGLTIDGLKEILNRIKGKVEGIGDQGHGGEEKNPDTSHQYNTTMKHAVDPTDQQIAFAKLIGPGIGDYSARAAMIRDLERTGKIKDEDTDEGLGSKILGGAAIIAALWGVNNHLANQAYEASPQLQKLTQYYQQAEAEHDDVKMQEIERRIEAHKARLDLGHGDVMDPSGRPKEIVPEMMDILKLAGLKK